MLGNIKYQKKRIIDFDPNFINIGEDNKLTDQSSSSGYNKIFNWSEMRLLLSKILWIVTYWRFDKIKPLTKIISIGSINGYEYDVLAELFPNFKFELYQTNIGKDKRNMYSEKLDNITRTNATVRTVNLNDNIMLCLDEVIKDNRYTVIYDRMTATNANSCLFTITPNELPKIPKCHYFFQVFASDINNEFIGITDKDSASSENVRDINKPWLTAAINYFNFAIRCNDDGHYDDHWKNPVTKDLQKPNDFVGNFDTMYMIYILNKYLIFSGIDDNESQYTNILSLLKFITQKFEVITGYNFSIQNAILSKSERNINYYITEKETNQFEPSMIILDFNKDKKIDYFEGSEVKKVLFVVWGQMKLLVGDIYFLTVECKLKATDEFTYVIAGSYTGEHYSILMYMYPNMTLHLWDPKFKQVHIDKYKKIAISLISEDEDPKREMKRFSKQFKINGIDESFENSSGMFTEGIAKKYSKMNVYFASDVRTAKGINPSEKEIIQDMKMQAEWVKTMQPIKSCLKFILPYVTPGITEKDAGTTKYLKGKIFKQIFTSRISTECRLIPDSDYKETTYNNKAYESIMFYYNRNVRDAAGTGTRFKNPFTNENISDAAEYPGVFDMMFYLWLLGEYIQTVNGENQDLSGEELYLKTLELAQSIKDIYKLYGNVETDYDIRRKKLEKLYAKPRPAVKQNKSKKVN